MNTLYSTLATAVIVGFTSLAARAQEKQDRVVAAFEQLQVSGAVNVVLQQGPTTQVQVEAPADLRDRVITEVKDGKLLVRHQWSRKDKWDGRKANRVFVYVTCPRLSGLSVSGASDVKGQGAFTADDFTIEASGASDVVLELTAKQLKATASGASDIRLTGRVERQQVRVSGASDYRAYELQSQTANVQASGASDAYLRVEGELVAQTSGASDVHYKGSAKLVR